LYARWSRWLVLSFVPLVAGCAEVPSLEACEPHAGLVPICGLQNPEDLALMPGEEWLVASQFPSEQNPAGSLVALRLADTKVVTAFPPLEAGGGSRAEASSEEWGDPSCPGSPEPDLFSPHGLDLVQRPGEKPMLLVVNHGGREAIELFEWQADPQRPRLHWRGCVLLPEQAWPNDVAGLPAGGMVVTSFLTGGSALRLGLSGIKLLLGWRTGGVVEWQPKRGWSIVANSEMSGPNGIAVSRDGSQLFVAAWGSGDFVRLDRNGNAPPETVALPHLPDNMSWAPDGKLLVTGQVASALAILRCGTLERGTCALPFSVVAIDPATLEIDLVFEHDGATAMGAATSAVQYGTDLYLGTFAGDRIARLPAARAAMSDAETEIEKFH
jgi:hypothetical protein